MEDLMVNIAEIYATNSISIQLYESQKFAIEVRKEARVKRTKTNKPNSKKIKTNILKEVENNVKARQINKPTSKPLKVGNKLTYKSLLNPSWLFRINN